MTSPLLGVHGRPNIKAPGLDEARAALDAADHYTATRRPGAMSGVVERHHLRSALTVADRLATENARLREALASLVTDCANTPMRDSRHFVNARRILAEVRDGR